VRGIAAAKAVPLIEDVQITAHPGERLVPFRRVALSGFIFARGKSRGWWKRHCDTLTAS